jgi:glycosyltransferase involved in cell wall biosynthesis
LYEGKSEAHDLIKPRVLGYSHFFNWINKKFNRGGGNLIKNNYELRYGFPPIFKFVRELISSRADVVVIKNIVNAYSLLSLILAKCLLKKVVFMVQIDKHRPKPRSWSVALVWWLLGAKSVTPLLGDVKHPNYNSSLIYIPFAHPAEEFNKTYFKNNKINLICVGKYQERKNQLSLVKAAEKLKDKYPLYIILVGQDDELVYTRELKDYIFTHHLSGMVSLEVNVPWREMPKRYIESDVFVLPSYHEPASYSIIEAMSYRLPVLSSRENGTSCYVSEGVNGYTFAAKNLEELTNKLERVVQDRERLKVMGEASFRIIKEKHSPEAFYREFMDVVGFNI